MSQSVKVYYIENQATKEIRKFSLESDVAGNFEYLAAKICQTFPDLLRKDIEVFWKDEENEYVTISSDDELHQALAPVHINSGLLKLYVKVKKLREQPERDFNEEAREHTGITCDGCDTTVRGIRYKCTQCYDFDLCSSCERKNMHPSDHEMICIKLPRTFNNFARNPRFTRGYRRGPRGRGGPFRRPGGFGWRFTPSFGYPPQQTSHQEPQNPGQEEGKTSEEQQQELRDSIPECIQMIATTFGFDPDVTTNFFEAYFGDISEKQGQKEDKTKDDKQNEEHDGVKEPESANKDGINTVDFQKQSSKGHDEVEKEDIPMEDLSSKSEEAAKTELVESKQSSVPKEDLSEISEEAAKTELLETEQNESDAQNSMEEEIQVPSEIPVVEESSRREEFILVDEEKEGERILNEEEKFQRRLEKALKQMEAMGFDNEGGWLKQLLVSKDLSIGRVLDALNPSN